MSQVAHELPMAPTVPDPKSVAALPLTAPSMYLCTHMESTGGIMRTKELHAAATEKCGQAKPVRSSAEGKAQNPPTLNEDPSPPPSLSNNDLINTGEASVDLMRGCVCVCVCVRG